MVLDETTKDLLQDLGIQQDIENQALEALVSVNSKYLKDLRINVKNVLQTPHISEKESALLAVAIAANNKEQVLLNAFKELALAKGASAEEVAESIACASLLSANNIFYRFRHFTGKEEYQKQSARIKMNIMMNPIIGKEFFELVSLAVSAVNGCEMCVNAHEHSLRELGATPERIFDAVRLAAVITSLGKVI